MLRQRVPLLSVLLVVLLLVGLAWAGRNSGGTYTLPAGNPVISGTTITSNWANTTLTDIGTEMTSSLDRQGRGPMLAPLQLVAGTSAAPGLAFSLEPGSGLYRAGAGDIRWSVLTVPVLKLQSALMTTLMPLTVTGRTTTTNLTVTGTCEALTVSPTTADTNAVTATGRGTGVGVLGIGGVTDGVGVAGVGSGTTGVGVRALGAPGGTAVGLTAQSGGSGGNALEATVLAGSYIGVVGNGHGTGGGVFGTGGATSGYGVGAQGGVPNGNGVQATAAGTGAGITATGGATGPGGTFSSGTAATAAVRQDALNVTNGDINLTGATNPNSTVAISNRITPKNITKAWGAFVIGAAGAVTMTDGFNIATVASSGSACGGATTVDINFASTFSSSTSYAVVVGSADTSVICNIGPRVVAQTAGQVSIKFLATAFDGVTPAFGINNCQQVACGAGAAATHDWNGTKFTLIATGAQP